MVSLLLILRTSKNIDCPGKILQKIVPVCDGRTTLCNTSCVWHIEAKFIRNFSTF